MQYSYQFTFGEHDVAGTFKTWQALVFDAALDRRLGTMFIIAGDMAVVEAIFYGSEAEYRASPLHGRLPTPTKQDVKINGWLGHLAHMAEDELLPVSNVGVPFRSKTLGLRAQDRLSDELVDDLIAYLRHAPRGGADLNVIVFDAQGGATNDVATRATSYGHRDKVMFYQNYLVQLGGVDEKNVTFSSDLLELVSRALGAPEPIASTYAGYVDLDLGVGAKAGPTYWGENYPALQALKKKWDPRDVFHNPQSVVPA